MFPTSVELDTGSGWVDVTDSVLLDGGVEVTRGSGNETSPGQPAAARFSMLNTDGRFTPGNPMSDLYPFRRGAACRVGTWHAGTVTRMVLGGSTDTYVDTPDHASLDITGDIDIRFDGRHRTWRSPELLASKYRLSGNNRSWVLLLTETGCLQLIWSTDGTAANRVFVTSSVPVPQGNVRRAVRVTLDVNNGASGRTVTFYTAPTLAGPWTQLGSTMTSTPVTSIFSGTSPVEIGSGDGGTTAITGYGLWTGAVYGAEVRSGIGGSLVASPDFTAQPAGTTSFTDGSGRTWTLHGAAEIIDREIRFTGTVDELALSWPDGRHRGSPHDGLAVVNVTAAGTLRRLQQGQPPLASTLRRKLSSPELSDLVVAYWPFEDGAQATSIASGLPGGAPMQIGGKFSLGSSDDSFPAADGVLSISSGDGVLISAPVPSIPQVAGVRWEVTRFFRVDDPAVNPATTRLLGVVTNGSAARWSVELSSTQLFVVGTDSDGTVVALGSRPFGPEFVDTWAHIILEVADNGTNVDWAVKLIPIPVGVVFDITGSFAGNTGVPTAIQDGTTGPPSGVKFSHLVVTSGANVGWLAGVDTAWIGETAARRFWRLCREEKIAARIIGDSTVTSSVRGDPLRSERMGPQRVTGLFDLLSECAAVDMGRMYEQRDIAGLEFRTRQSLHNQTPAVVLDASADGLVPPLELSDDDKDTRNDVTVVRPSGSSARVTTDPPPEPGDRYAEQVTVGVASDAQVADQAGWRLHTGARTGMRLPSLRTLLDGAGPAVTDAWSSSNIGDRIVATELPPQVPAEVGMLVDGYTERLTQFNWEVSVNGPPSDPWEVAVRDDSAMGKRDTAGTVLSGAVTSTATTLPVTVTLGPAWTTAAGDYPFDLDVGGERVTATGWSSGFTVTRSVNEVVKAHAAGTPVRLWRPAIRTI